MRYLAPCAVGLLLLASCQSSSSTSSGVGGTSGGAGTTGAAGTTGYAGTTGAAGTTGGGGATGGTGVAGAAGMAGGGGRGGTAGSAGAGGVAGSAGSAGVGGAAGGAGTTGSGGRGGAGGAGGGNGGRGGAAGGAGVGGAAGGGAGGRGGAGGWTADGGGGAPADGGAADGGVAYDPCPKTGVCSIMPLGDSITYGVGSSGSGGGYRVPLFQLAVTASQHITFVGRNMNGPTTVAEQSFPQGHEGYSGYTIEDAPAPISRNGIYPLVDGAMSMFHPNIVLLMIGTNDVNQNNDLANAPTRLGQLIDKIVGDGPDALLVVAKIIPTGTDSTNVAVQTFNDAIPGVVATRVAAGKHVVVVDMYTPFAAVAAYRTALMSDNLHPNDTGYMAMAEAWYAVIRAYLPAM